MKNLVDIFSKYNFELSSSQQEQFDKYFNMLVETNKYMNLTAITEENEVIFKHFLDSVLPHENILKNSKIVDVGSGAGFPALPLKILRPDLNICMVDSLNKRINFLNGVINELKLTKITAIHSRAEDFAKNNREKYDFAVARAVAPLNTLVEYLLPLIKVGGKAIIYKSSKLNEEIELSENAIKILGAEIEKVEKFYINEFELERNVLILRKINKTPQKYPRDKNKPKTNPIV